MIPEGEARGAEADLYPGKAPNVLRAMSLVPDAVRRMQDLSSAQYIPLDQLANPSADPGRALSRAQIELIAGRVSALNECFY
jgi:alkylhydroperoxidase family enzyme